MDDEIKNGNGGVEVDDEIESAELLNLSPAMPGWFACYTEDENPRALHVFPIAAFGVIEVTRADNETYRVVRPFAASPDGELEDVYDFPNFLCIVGPGQDPREVASEAREAQAKKAASRIIVSPA